MIIVTLKWSIPITSPNKVPSLRTFWFLFFNVHYFIWTLSPNFPWIHVCTWGPLSKTGWAESPQNRQHWGQAPVSTNKSLARRWGQNLRTQNGGAVSTRGSIATSTLVASVKEKISSGTTWSSISYRKFNFLLWDPWHVVRHWPEWHPELPDCIGFSWKCQLPVTSVPSSCMTWTMRTLGVSYMGTIGNLLDFSITLKLL